MTTLEAVFKVEWKEGYTPDVRNIPLSEFKKNSDEWGFDSYGFDLDDLERLNVNEQLSITGCAGERVVFTKIKEENTISNDNKLEIFTVPKYSGNAYIMETIDGYFDTLWVAPLFHDDTIDNSQWLEVEDEEIILNVLDSSERTVIDDIRVDDFVNLLITNQI